MKLLCTALFTVVMLACAGCEGRATREPLYSGTIEAVQVDIVAEVGGRILSRPVDQGDHVEPKTPIAFIDPAPYRLALSEVEASLAGARAKEEQLTAGYRTEEVQVAAREVDEAEAVVTQAEARIARVEQLLAQGIVAPDDLDVARRDRDAAKARLAAAKQRHSLVGRGYRREEIDQARAEVTRLTAMREQRALDLEKTTVLSPITGTVTEKLIEAGEYANPGSPIVSVADLVHLYTWVYLSEVELGRVRLGDQVDVRIDGQPGRSFPGKVVYIATQAEFTPKNVQTVEDRVQLVFGVKVAVDNPGGELKVGIPADVALPRHSSPP